MSVKISDLSNYSSPQTSDVLPIVDVSSGVTKKVTAAVLVGAFLPTGLIVPFGSTSAPTGWLVCDGSAVSRTTYATLYALVGTAFGSGDGSTTFNLPDMRGKVPVGKSSDTEFLSIGKTGGAKTHTLTTSEMPSHNHTQSSHTHTFTAPAGSPGGWGAGPGDGSRFRADSNSPANSWTWGLNSATPAIQNTGGGGSHNNLQPYNTLVFIIKA